ncbi:MAG TPA: CBS domain-containing protein [Gemmatimonadaceae bacterium]|nr:CBS domain-containing protein [Gemmatimonadaceae bacterium]
MKANEIMTSEPVCVTPDTPIQEAARLMKDQNVGMLPVVRAEGSKQLIGVITDRDIALRHVAEGHTSGDCPVREAMTEHVTTANPNSDVDEVMDIMGKEQVRRIPIVDERGELVGVVAQADVVIHAKNDKKAERTIEEISQPFGKHAG